jgi:signal peptidase I
LGAENTSRRSRFVVGLELAGGVVALAIGGAIFFAGFSLNTVTSGSMRPSIQPGDLVVLQRVPSTALKVGDVIAYATPQGGEPLLHRIVTLDPRPGAVLVQTQGDANQTPDYGPVQLDVTAYRMVASIPLLGLLIELRAWIWLAFGAVLLLIALGWVKGVVRAKFR